LTPGGRHREPRGPAPRPSGPCKRPAGARAARRRTGAAEHAGGDGKQLDRGGDDDRAACPEVGDDRAREGRTEGERADLQARRGGEDLAAQAGRRPLLPDGEQGRERRAGGQAGCRGQRQRRWERRRQRPARRPHRQHRGTTKDDPLWRPGRRHADGEEDPGDAADLHRRVQVAGAAAAGAELL